MRERQRIGCTCQAHWKCRRTGRPDSLGQNRTYLSRMEDSKACDVGVVGDILLLLVVRVQVLVLVVLVVGGVGLRKGRRTKQFERAGAGRFFSKLTSQRHFDGEPRGPCVSEGDVRVCGQVRGCVWLGKRQE